MCLIAVALNQHQAWPLVIIANRDEFHDRPTAQAAWRKTSATEPQQLAWFGGLDLRAGGSWMGIRADGLFAAVTNVREGLAAPTERPSRGVLVPLIMNGINDEAVTRELANTGPCNLIDGSLRTQALRFRSNRFAPQALASPGVHGLSNGDVNTNWPKVQRLKNRLQQLIRNDFKPETDAMTTTRSHASVETLLFDLLSDPSPASDADLPNTGVGLAWERRLSPIKIVGSDYGTRSSMVIILNAQGLMTVSERQYSVTGELSGERSTRFSLNPNKPDLG